MMIFDMRDTQEQYKEEILYNVMQLDKPPLFKIIQVGDDFASNKYIYQKMKHCEDVGIDVRLIKLPEAVTTGELVGVVKDEQQRADAIIVQMPLPAHINEREVLDTIDPLKDVDCLTTTNIGLLHSGHPYVEPCTPAGIVEILNILDSIEGKNILIIGRSNIVGKPLAECLTARDATVTLAHSKTRNLGLMLHGGRYDVIVAAVGSPKRFTAHADVLIDVGINFDEDGKMCGDFDLDRCEYKVATPVPNGVGRMTIIGLLKNILFVASNYRCINCGSIFKMKAQGTTACGCGTHYKRL